MMICVFGLTGVAEPVYWIILLPIRVVDLWRSEPDVLNIHVAGHFRLSRLPDHATFHHPATAVRRS